MTVASIIASVVAILSQLFGGIPGAQHAINQISAIAHNWSDDWDDHDDDWDDDYDD
ncbi:hypothetical protein ACXM2N_03905 [Corynebacterium sp. ZY180755]